MLGKLCDVPSQLAEQVPIETPQSPQTSSTSPNLPTVQNHQPPITLPQSEEDKVVITVTAARSNDRGKTKGAANAALISRFFSSRPKTTGTTSKGMVHNDQKKRARREIVRPLINVPASLVIGAKAAAARPGLKKNFSKLLVRKFINEVIDNRIEVDRDGMKKTFEDSGQCIIAEEDGD